MPHDSDPGIPTLTQRVEPSLAPLHPVATPPAEPRQSETSSPSTPGSVTTPLSHAHADLPVLTDRATSAPWDDEDPPVLTDIADTAHDTDVSALNAALQAELQQALQQAIDEANVAMRARLQAELPAMIERAINKAQSG